MAAFLTISAAAFAAPASIEAATEAKPSIPAGLLSRIPVRFEASARHPGEQWIARGSGFAAGISDDGAILALGTRTLRLRFPGSDAGAAFQPAQASATPSHYFIRDASHDESAYHRLRRASIYPGIDLVYYGRGESLEYDFELAPHADPSQIRISFDGAHQVALGPDGELRLTLADGEIVQQAPAVYQRDAQGSLTTVASRYFPEADGSYSIRLNSYDSAQPVVIDPQLLFTAYLAGTGAEEPVGLGMDKDKNLYVVGFTHSTDFPLVGEAYSGFLLNANEHIFTTKLNPFLPPDQVISYSGFFGSEFGDYLRAVTVDQAGVIYMTGYTDDFFYPTTPTAFSTNNGSVRRMFFAALDTKLPGTTGLIYSTFYGGARIGKDDPTTTTVDESQPALISDEPTAIAVGPNGHVFIAGFNESDDYPLKNPIQTTRVAGIEGFLVEFDITKSGADSVVNSTYFGGFSVDIPKALAVDSKGKVLMSGYTHSSDFPTTVNAFKPFYSGAGDVFLTKFDLNAAKVEYSTYIGGSGIDQAWRMTLDAQDHAVLAGFTLSPDYPVSQNAAQSVYGGDGDAFLTIIDPTADPFPKQLVYSTFYGGSDGEVAYDLRQGPTGAYFLSGYTLSRDLPARDALRPVSAESSTDGFVAAIDPALGLNGLLYSSYVTGAGYQIAKNVEVDPSGNVYVAGVSFGNIFDPGQATPPENGATDVFLFVFRPSVEGLLPKGSQVRSEHLVNGRAR